MTNPPLQVLIRLLTIDELDMLFPAASPNSKGYVDNKCRSLHQGVGECWRLKDHAGPHRFRSGSALHLWDDVGNHVELPIMW